MTNIRARYAEGVAALHWLTCIPWPWPAAGAAPRLAAALWAFPAVGALVGAAGGVLYAVARHLGASPGLAAVAGIAGMVLLTGALHEDGFGDFCDGLGRQGDAAARIEAMRDSRLGAFGAIGLALILLARVEALAMLAGAAAMPALALAAGAGRWAIGLAMLWGAPATAAGAGAAAGRAGAGPVLAGAALLLGLIILASPALGFGAAVAPVLAGLATAAGVTLAARRCFGGYTGDVLGATSLLAETLSLVALALVAR